MGFTRTRCIDALLHTQSLEEATEHLLSQSGADRFSPPPVQVNYTKDLLI